MSRSRTARFSAATISLLAVAALALTGCSQAPDTEKDGAKKTPQGPLEKYMSALWNEDDYTQERMDEQQKQMEELVAECMTKEGFEYKPNVQSQSVTISSSDEDIDWNSEEFVKEYGYGTVRWPGMEQTEEVSEEEYSDPNEDYITSLSESEQQAFYETLYGPQPSEDEIAAMEDEDEPQEYDWTTAGCQGAAEHEVRGDGMMGSAAYEDPEFTDLFSEMEAVWSVLYDEENPHEGLVALNREWEDCMADSGYSAYTSPTDAQQQVMEEYEKLQMPDGEDGEYKELGKEEQDEFAKHEMEVALADLSCKKKTDYEGKARKIQFDLEQKFVDEHKAELDALVAKHGVDKKK
ncbi:MAG: hypothetical protein ACK5LO_12890 [Leucobacter sp.]